MRTSGIATKEKRLIGLFIRERCFLTSILQTTELKSSVRAFSILKPSSYWADIPTQSSPLVLL